MKKTVVVLALLSTFLIQLMHAQSGCLKYESPKGFRLAELSFHQYVVRDIWSCLLRCQQTERCQSVNYHLATSLCEHNNRTRAARPSLFVPYKDAVYFDNPSRAVLGTTAAQYGLSCQEIKLSSPTAQSGSYWIDPLESGQPFTVFCDMSTDGGGWTLLAQTVITTDQRGTTLIKETDYRKLSNYSSDARIDVPAISRLQRGLRFRQLRYYCTRPSTGTTVHLMTGLNSLGYSVVRYFVSDPSSQPAACGSFVRLPDDNSVLASSCGKWGDDGKVTECSKWGHFVNNGTYRIYNTPMFWANVTYYSALPPSRLLCDELSTTNNTRAPGDSWKVFVR